MTDQSVPLPDRVIEHAQRFYAEGRAPATPRDAATVVLLRSAPNGFEVYMLRRAATMAFASGMYAFPGGAVDPRDTTAPVRLAGPAPSQWAVWLGQDEPAARAVICAAVREVFEECGVLLAGPSPLEVVGDVSGDDWEAQRVALVNHELGFGELLTERGLILRADLIRPWARWVTPEFEPRRYDTYFFLAQLPEGQVTRDVSGEADLVRWVRPADALAEGLPMFPPTAVTLSQLNRFDSEAAALAGATLDLSEPFQPRLDVTADGGRLTIPPPA